MTLLLLSAFLLNPHLASSSRDIVLADFEGETYAPWTTTGEAFGTKPAPGTLPGQMTVSGYRGHGLANSFVGGDDSVGTLTSPPFAINRHTIRFLIGGGKNLQTTAMNLLVDGKIVRSATGLNDRPGGSEALEPAFWDVRDLYGKTGVIQVIDRATGGWGHVCVDDIVLTDKAPPAVRLMPMREFRVSHGFLNFPIKCGAPKQRVTILVDGHSVVENEMELAEDKPDWWAPMDVRPFPGKSLAVQIDRLSSDSKLLSNITQSEAPQGDGNLYKEERRGQFHFSPRRGWTNDPNGLVRYRGEYHLFFQHNPYGTEWGNMHWGHAVSPDLVHWNEVGEALLPDRLGPMYSGSAVVDWNNSSGLGTSAHPPLVLIYTAAGDPSVQCIASSTDGRTFTKYAGNPVVPQITPGNRDPKVFWHEPSKHWVMTLYVEQPGRHTVEFLRSTNLKHWEKTSEIDSYFECPDFFPLALGADHKWVLTAANSDYQVGSFDGTKFTPETPLLKGNHGTGFYAAQTFSDIPAEDGRRIQIGWFQTPTPGMPFNQSMTIPQVLSLRATADGPCLARAPIRELDSLRTIAHELSPRTLTPRDPNPLADLHGELIELHADFAPSTEAQIQFTVRGAKVRYDAATEEIVVNDHRATAPLVDGKIRLAIYCDRMGLEVFVNDGLTYVPMPFLPEPDNRSLRIEATGGAAEFSRLEVFELKSAWVR